MASFVLPLLVFFVRLCRTTDFLFRVRCMWFVTIKNIFCPLSYVLMWYQKQQVTVIRIRVLYVHVLPSGLTSWDYYKYVGRRYISITIYTNIKKAKAAQL